MNKKVLFTAMSIVVLVAAAFVMAGDDAMKQSTTGKPWLDMKNCEFCKPWVETGLMNVMTHEQHPIANGVCCISTVPEAKMAEYKKASDMMDVLGKKAAAGEKVNMCGSCETMGSFFGRGATMEMVWLKNGSIMLLTSADKAVTADMHKWVQKNNEEFAKMAAMPEK